ncbi:MAG TPA: SDR family NAD(P)-dependent oxidoreductase [Pseudonocardia sp.]|nr:SDR family NAD(P)-dependent oxidoreductase [Pseudonocardia sp.]
MNGADKPRPGKLADHPIAIVGMAGLFPKAHNFREYWQNIVDGRDCTDEVPPSRWNLDDYYDPDPSAPDKTYARRGAFLPDVDFDPLEFGLPPSQLDITSTLQTLSLVVARDLLRDAGAVDSEWYDPSRTGVVLGTTGTVALTHPLTARLATPVLKEVARSCGLSDADADAIAAKYVTAFPAWQESTFPGLLANVTAGRIANRFDLGGLNCTVDAACAASLAAVRLAIAELVDGRADLMITGGCDTENSIFMYMCFSKTQALSRTDRIRPFDESADGTLLGEGIGMVALKRLADAERDGDRVYAVIRGIGSASDGRAKSIYAPRAEGQQLALRRAYADADCSPGSVQLFEAHATGTAVGDRTELQALTSVLSEATDDRQFAAVGSVKSQIGHTKGTAGTASLMKLALSLYQKTLPATLNVERPNAALGGPDSPVYINTSTRPWIKDPNRPVRRAAASAAGFGGTNFHIVLEEHRSGREGTPVLHRTARAHLWHAPDVAGLIELIKGGAPGADGGPIPPDHARVGFVAVGAEAETRLREAALSQLAADPDADRWSHPAGVYFQRAAPSQVTVGALFAGQGSQYLGMGLDVVLANPVVAGAFDEANTVFTAAEESLADTVYPRPTFDAAIRKRQESALHRTECAQPAIGALSVGQFRYLRDLGLHCAGFLGHSFGELTALWAAGALADDAFFALACARGEAMASGGRASGGRASGGTGSGGGASDEDRGAMAAVEAGRDDVAALLADFPDVVLCNHNAPDQVVVGGGTAAVAAVVAECGRLGLRSRTLPVSAAFHTEYVAHAVDRFRPAVLATRIGPPSAPVYANSPGARYGSDVEANQRTLVEQLRQPVEFLDALRAMHRDGCTVFVEFGPKQVLTQLVGRALPDADVVAIPTDAGPLGDGDTALKKAALRLAVLGVPVAGINRHDAPAPELPASRGMTITLNGAEYVPDTRKAAYRAALDDGFTVSTSVPAPSAPAPDAVPPGVPPVPEAPPASANGHHKRIRTDAAPIPADPVQQHLALHERYLEGQLRITEDLAAAVRHHADHPGDPDRLLSTIEQVKAQSIGIGRTHTRANEILADLAALGTGTSAPAPMPAPLPVSALPAFQIPVQAGVPEPATTAVPPPPPAPPPARSGPTAPSGPTGTDLPDPADPPATGTEPASAALSADTVRTVLITVVAERTGYPATVIDTGMDLEADLGVDSIKRVQILEEIRERMPGVPVLGPEQLGELRTLDDIADYLVASQPEDRPAGSGQPAALDSPGEADLPAAQEPPVDADVLVGPEAVAALLPVELVTLPPVDRAVGVYRESPAALLVDYGGTDASVIAGALEAAGWSVRRARLSAGANGTGQDGGDRLGPQLAGVLPPGEHLDLCLAIFDGQQRWDDALDQLADAVSLAGHAVTPLCASASAGHRAAFVTVTRLDGGLGLRGTRACAEAIAGGVGGVTKTLAREEPTLFCRALDLDPALAAEEAASAVLAELHDAAQDCLEVGVDASLVRRTPVPDAHQALPSPTDSTDLHIGPDDVVIVTGGGRGITAHCARALAERTGAEFVLLGRSALADEPSWAQGVADAALADALAASALAGAGAATAAGAGSASVRLTPREFAAELDRIRAGREVRRTLAALAAAGSRASYLNADVGDPGAVRAALSGYAERATVLVHGAGVLRDGLLRHKTASDTRQVLTPKLAGLRAVLDALPGAPLRHVVLFTSVAGLLGNPGQADYASANEALCRVAASMRREHPGRQVTAIDWWAWDGGMVDADLRALFESRGVGLLAVQDGVRLFLDALRSTAASRTRLLAAPPNAFTGTDLAGVSLTGTPEPRPSPARVAARNLTGVEDTEVIKAHRIGAHAVLPATFGLGWLVNVLERANPGLRAVECLRFEVHRGIVFDGTHSGEYLVEVDPAQVVDQRLVASARVRGAAGTNGTARARSHFAATVVLAARPVPGGVLAGWRHHPLEAGGEDALDWYAKGTLFHGPRLQGLRRVLRRGDRQLIMECQLPDDPDTGGPFAGALYSPVLTDLLMQVGAVLGSWRTGQPALPLGVARVECFAPLPDDEPFVVVADELRSTATSSLVTVTACDRGGTVLMRLSEVSCVSTPDMAAKFAAAVSAWREDGAR